MQIQKINPSELKNSKTDDVQKSKQVTFKSGNAVLALSGNLMQGIESTGYVASFLIQDMLGMTVPRVMTGFNRDKEVTGHYNTKEGLEVLGREGMTGPYMMAVAPILLAIFGKACKSSNTNTRLIKAIGRNFKEMLENNVVTDGIKQDKDKFLDAFNRYNIEKFYKNTIPEDKNPDDAINYILNEFKTYSSKDKKASKQALQNILDKLNERVLTSSANFDELCKLNDVVDNKTTSFTATEVLRAIKDFGTDAISKNSEFSKIDKGAVENIKNNFAAKRLLFNISSIALTLGGLAVLPKLYARNTVAPGAEQFAAARAKAENEQDENNQNPSFKAKGINADGIFSKIGKFITKHFPDLLHKEFEYSGYNFTPSLMASLTLGGLLLPRGIHAYKRALVFDDGTRDMTEVNEILIRDTISSLSVVYTVPILTKLIVNSYEKKQGFILTNRAAKDISKWKRFTDLINPYGKFKVLSNAELKALYQNIDTVDKMKNFCAYISEKRGDLGIMLGKSDGASDIFNDKTFTLDSIKNLDKNEKNKKISAFFNDFAKHTKELMGKDDIETQNALVKKLMQNADDISKSKLAVAARGLTSIPGLIATFIISPAILGWLIPKLTYAKTRKDHEKMLQKTQNTLNTAA